MVAAELQLYGDLLLFSVYCLSDSVQNQVHRLFRSGFVGHNAVEVPDRRQVQHSLFGVDVRNVRYPFAIESVCVKVSVEKLLVFVYPAGLSAATSCGAESLPAGRFLHDTQNGFGVVVNPFAFFSHCRIRR